MHGQAEITPQSVLDGNGVRLHRRVDPVLSAVREWQGSGRRVVVCELNAFEAVVEDLTISERTFSSGPDAVGAQIGKGTKIQVDLQPGRLCRSVVEEARSRCHSSSFLKLVVRNLLRGNFQVGQHPCACLDHQRRTAKIVFRGGWVGVASKIIYQQGLMDEANMAGPVIFRQWRRERYMK